MSLELKVPPIGESITEVQIGSWLKAVGDFVERDEPVVEIESDKATVEISAPASGTITQMLKKEGEAARVGEVIGFMEAGEAVKEKKTPPTKKETAEKAKSASAPVNVEPRVMPAARRALAETGVNLENVQATGPGGRVLKEDVLVAAKLQPAPEKTSVSTQKPTRSDVAAAASSSERIDTVTPMSPMRKRIAERLVSAQQDAALLTTFNEVDMSAVMALREQYRDEFQKKHSVKLGFMSFFVKASVDGLKTIPQVNAAVNGTDIVYHNYCDIGIAVGGGKGLAVPIMRNAETLSFAAIESAIADFAARAKENKLSIDELQGGTFTISNGGIYGSMLSTPIVNPPQSAILGLHAIQDRPMAKDGQVVIRPMMYLALTYDHRIIDGREAVAFLKRVKECIENPARLLLEV